MKYGKPIIRKPLPKSGNIGGIYVHRSLHQSIHSYRNLFVHLWLHRYIWRIPGMEYLSCLQSVHQLACTGATLNTNLNVKGSCDPYVGDRLDNNGHLLGSAELQVFGPFVVWKMLRLIYTEIHLQNLIHTKVCSIPQHIPISADEACSNQKSPRWVTLNILNFRISYIPLSTWLLQDQPSIYFIWSG